MPHGLLRIRTHYNALKPAERKVADFIQDNFDQVIHYSITKLAQSAGVSEATVVKFCQRLGYSGYQEMKILLAQSDEKGGRRRQIYSEIEADDGLEEIIEKIFQIYDESLDGTRKLLRKGSIGEAVEMFLSAERVFFLGYGASGLVARDGELKFKRIGWTAQALCDNHDQKTVGPLMQDGDLVVAISDSGRTKELVDSLGLIRDTPAAIIAITSSWGSPVTELADITLLMSSRETPFRGSALASRMAQLAVLDVLFLGVATRTYEKTLEALEKTRIVMQESKI